MSEATPSFEEIGPGKWSPIMATITRIYRGAHGKLEVMGPGVGYQVETEDKPFEGIAADLKDGERIVWIHFRDLEHAVHRARVVRMVPQIGEEGPVIEIEDEDRIRTILSLSSPVEYALPPGDE